MLRSLVLAFALALVFVGSALGYDPALLVGNWAGGRHTTLYRADGTWALTPVDPDTLHGTWKITSDKLIETTDKRFGGGETITYTILKLTKTELRITNIEGDTEGYRLVRLQEEPK